MHGSHDKTHGMKSHLHGHNSVHTETVQWQTLHATHHHDHDDVDDEKKDLDLVEKSFVEGFHDCSDPTSFLRMVGIPFTGVDANGRNLHLLRVELENSTDVGTLTPHLGGESFNYSPLPAKLTSKRNMLSFVYHCGEKTVKLSLEEAKSLENTTA